MKAADVVSHRSSLSLISVFSKNNKIFWVQTEGIVRVSVDEAIADCLRTAPTTRRGERARERLTGHRSGSTSRSRTRRGTYTIGPSWQPQPT